MNKNENPSNAFAQMLTQLRAGSAADDASEKLTELVAAVKESGKTGTITVKIKVAPASAGDVTKLLITDSISMSRPEKVRPATLFFPSEDNALLRSDPAQKELDLKSVPAAPAEQTLREVVPEARPLAVAK